MSEFRFKHYDEFDALITLASAECIEDEVSNFLKIAVTDVPSTKSSHRIERLIRRDKNKYSQKRLLKCLKIVAVACLIVMSLAFTACMTIPQVRASIWEAVIEWYDEYIAICFEPSKAPNVSSPPEEAPATIEEINVPTYLPQGYTLMSAGDDLQFCQECYDADGELAYIFFQLLRDNSNTMIDSTDAAQTVVDINGVEGVLISGSEGMISLVWKDLFYTYELQGFGLSEEELLRIARSVKELH